MIPVVSVAHMRAADAAEIASRTPSRELMRRAGRALFLAVDWPENTAILVGGGNNGGDGWALAAELAQDGKHPTVIGVSDKVSEDGAAFRTQALAAGVRTIPFDPDTDLSGYDMLVDCLLGTGFAGEPRGTIATAIRRMNSSGRPVISADINSGLNGDTGEAILAVRSALTVTIGLYKTGLLDGSAPAYIGQLRLADIGISPLYPPDFRPAPDYLIPDPLIVR